MGVLTSLRARAALRYLLVFRLDPAAVAPLLPRGMRPLDYRGFTPLALCFTRLERPGPRWIPEPVGGPRDHLAWRVAALRPRALGGGAPVRAAWVPRRDTSSRLGARCAGLLTRGGYHVARFELEADERCMALTVRTAEGERIHVAGERTDVLRGSMFATARQAEDCLAEARAAHPADPLAPTLDRLALSDGQLALDPMRVRELCTGDLERLGLPGAATAELDCLLRVVALRRVSTPARIADTPLDPAAAV